MAKLPLPPKAADALVCAGCYKEYVSPRTISGGGLPPTKVYPMFCYWCENDPRVTDFRHKAYCADCLEGFWSAVQLAYHIAEKECKGSPSMEALVMEVRSMRYVYR